MSTVRFGFEYTLYIAIVVSLRPWTTPEGQPGYAAQPTAWLGAAILLSFYLIEEATVFIPASVLTGWIGERGGMAFKYRISDPTGEDPYGGKAMLNANLDLTKLVRFTDRDTICLERLLVAWNFARITGFVPVSYAYENFVKWAAKEGRLPMRVRGSPNARHWRTDSSLSCEVESSEKYDTHAYLFEMLDRVVICFRASPLDPTPYYHIWTYNPRFYSCR